uniref:DDE Tnp4 domain-containing protein n=1 Tax=Paramormyrops kingsleyae TaxID=1676925 RepID=A0A3B3SZR7_9TELE
SAIFLFVGILSRIKTSHYCSIMPFSEDSQRDSEMVGVVHRHHHFARRGYRQRMYVERTKPLEQYTTEELYVRFRFGKADIEYLVNLLRPKLKHRTQRSHGLSVEDQILIALRFYACGTFYQVVGDYMGVVKSAVCDVVRDVSIALATIDCTHVHIQAPRENEWEFINRKGRHSINVQLVCDADLIITNCVVKWPGSVHDARILRESALYRDLQTNRPDGIILGDTNTPAKARFNTAHCRARCAIWRLNGVLKRRFACLNYLRAEPQKACNITLACIVLHNIATKRNVPLSAAPHRYGTSCLGVPNIGPPAGGLLDPLGDQADSSTGLLPPSWGEPPQ